MIGRVALLVTFKKAKPKPQSLSRSHIRDLCSMMKFILHGILLTFLTSCQSVTAPNHLRGSHAMSTTGSNEVSLHETWGLVDYLDSTVVQKEIARFRQSEATMMAILMILEGDTLVRTFGSVLYNQSYTLEPSKDTIAMIQSKISRDTWALIKQGDLIKMAQVKVEFGQIDSNIYTLRRRHDLDTMTNGDQLQFERCLTQYFHRHIFEGSYTNAVNGDTVRFSAPNKISGLSNYDSYWVNGYFGTSHPFKEKDAVLLINSITKESSWYNWSFNNNRLVLIPFAKETIKVNGEWKETDEYVLSNENILLVHH